MQTCVGSEEEERQPQEQEERVICSKQNCEKRPYIGEVANGTRAAGAELQLRPLAPYVSSCQLPVSVHSAPEEVCGIPCRGRRVPIGKQRSGMLALHQHDDALGLYT